MTGRSLALGCGMQLLLLPAICFGQTYGIYSTTLPNGLDVIVDPKSVHKEVYEY